MMKTRGWWLVFMLCAPACSERAKEHSECEQGGPDCPPGTGGQLDGGAGGVGGVGGAGGMVSVVDGGVQVRIEDPDGQEVQVVALPCDDQCIEVRAIASGGNPPHTYTWSDGTTGDSTMLCAGASLSVTATDTAIDAEEFAFEAQRGEAEVSSVALDCPGAPCREHATAGSFDPVVKWTWNGGYSYITPLVANFTDDNGDGVVNLADTPDVVVTAFFENGTSALFVLDGATGEEHFRVMDIDPNRTPALGDIDNDGHINIVAYAETDLLALRHDGTELWRTPAATHRHMAIALADLDHDGSTEIISGRDVRDAGGTLLWSASAMDVPPFSSPTAVDLDDDGFLEVIWGAVAYRHDGTLYFRNTDVLASDPVEDGALGVFVAVADLTGDGSPEIVVTTRSKLFVLDNHGVTLSSVSAFSGDRTPFPPAIHDLDGDGVPEVLVGNGRAFRALDTTLGERWSMPVIDNSGIAAGTAFDFLGDGSAEAMYGDENTTWGFDGVDGHVVFQEVRNSHTLIEYPAVADVDNDGSADILVVSSSGPSPGLQVLSDREARWIPARRILNQESYHVTNINEDGTIPTHEEPHWRLNNSFRSQAQVNAQGDVCLPVTLE